MLDNTLIRDLFLQHKTYREIALIFNVHKETIGRKVREMKLIKPKKLGSRTSLYRFRKEKGLVVPKKRDRLNYEQLYDLYAVKKLGYREIAKKLGLTKWIVYRDLKSFNLLRNRSEARLVEYERNLRVPKAPKCKTYYYEGLRCQGLYELTYIQNLKKQSKELPQKGKAIKTPYGIYIPDFEFIDKLIEIKSSYTLDVAKGKKLNLNGEFSDKQYKKILWVNENIKPVEIKILDK